jgi:hypothetical protein
VSGGRGTRTTPMIDNRERDIVRLIETALEVGRTMKG